jgi:hypothetical protein
MPATRCIFGVLIAAALLTMFAGGVADAKGVVWCVRDPIFEIDGRIVQVQDLIPAENANAPIHFVLRVAKGSSVSWHLPEGEILLGSVTIVTDGKVSRDSPRLSVRGEGTPFPMRVNVSGNGLRSASYEVQGTSRGIDVALRLVRLVAGDDVDD